MRKFWYKMWISNEENSPRQTSVCFIKFNEEKQPTGKKRIKTKRMWWEKFHSKKTKTFYEWFAKFIQLYFGVHFRAISPKGLFCVFIKIYYIKRDTFERAENVVRRSMETMWLLQWKKTSSFIITSYCDEHIFVCSKWKEKETKTLRSILVCSIKLFTFTCCTFGNARVICSTLDHTQ